MVVILIVEIIGVLVILTEGVLGIQVILHRAY